MEGRGTLDTKQFISKVNDWKMKLMHASDGIPRREFKPLQVKEHPRQAQMDQYRKLPSRYAP